MAEDDRITLIIEGLPEDDGQVRLGVFLSQLQNFSATLTKLDREANNGKTATVFRIAELSYRSPIRVVLEPQARRKQPYVGPAILESLGRVTAALTNGHDLAGLDADLLEDIRRLTQPVGKTVKNAAFVFKGQTFSLTQEVGSKVDIALAIDEECEGSVEGRLEQINVHQGANVFHIYPEVGLSKVTCKFPGRLYDDAVAAVGRRVEVSGTLHYRVGASFAHQIAVSHIEALPPESELPDWDDMRGRAPNATGSLSSEDFVRELRDGWH
ncbi:MAG: hypothetical protein WCA56_07675 [Xanthobacteraceae bacterium]